MSILLELVNSSTDAITTQAGVVSYAFDFDTDPSLPEFDDGADNPLQTIFSWGQGVVVIIGIIGVLFAAGKMAIGKFGRSDLAADGVGSLVWVVFGISLMLIAIPLILAIGGVG
ncbi:hypothetical protein J4H86_06735 [Spiractinospora alimapuensis]|uniref:hypothetical protein n=1 Tax=Spiractinospora alimapuensis TaxID=2820884 RepID=UPI001F318091|nr:hypothetical protein [Spiractinospora alimapuensis]QVQ53448.1 hypothetical protein J4H86_06735 [Spiractinospora alimapuensis]